MAFLLELLRCFWRIVEKILIKRPLIYLKKNYKDGNLKGLFY